VVLVAGGINFSGTYASSELYDPAIGSWSATGDLNTGRYQHTATLLLDGMVLAAGGLDISVTALASAELYAPSGPTPTPAPTATPTPSVTPSPFPTPTATNSDANPFSDRDADPNCYTKAYSYAQASADATAAAHSAVMNEIAIRLRN
jgi:hypothetical protein